MTAGVAGHGGAALTRAGCEGAPVFSADAVMAHVKVLASDEFEGRAPGTQRRGHDGRLHRRPVPEGRREARRRRRHLHPEGADGGHHGRPGHVA